MSVNYSGGVYVVIAYPVFTDNEAFNVDLLIQQLKIFPLLSKINKKHLKFNKETHITFLYL